MAEMTNIASAGEGQPAFDAGAWLARFKQVGGTAWQTSDGLGIGWEVLGDTDEQCLRARAVYGEVEGRREALEAISAHMSDRSAWEALLARYEAAEAVTEAAMEDDDIDASVDAAHELLCALMDMPAPDKRALRWKLDYLLGGPAGQGSTMSWSREFVAQTVADIERFLGEA
ncbi:MAG: hypothetical protein KGL48_00085 [Sphingomonadales bacterium]|nr:hypothetical protein [Sphingomonadales bacterium]